MALTSPRKAVVLLALALVLTDNATAARTTQTPGALLFHLSSEPAATSCGPPAVARVAISLGDDR